MRWLWGFTNPLNTTVHPAPFPFKTTGELLVFSIGGDSRVSGGHFSWAPTSRGPKYPSNVVVLNFRRQHFSGSLRSPFLNFLSVFCLSNHESCNFALPIPKTFWLASLANFLLILVCIISSKNSSCSHFLMRGKSHITIWPTPKGEIWRKRLGTTDLLHC